MASVVQQHRHLKALADLGRVAKALDAASVPWVVGKGPVAAAVVWPAADMREYHDLDIYIPRHAFPIAIDALLGAGCEGVDRNWPEMERLMRAEYAMRAPFGTMLDVHWDIAVRPDLRRAFRIDLPEMVTRARLVALGPGQHPTFDATDTVLLFAFHAAQAGANKLVWLGDVHFGVRSEQFSWPELRERAGQYRITVPIGIVLDRTAQALGGERPDIAPTSASTWRRFVRWYDQRHPLVFLAGDKHAAGIPAGAARPGLTRSIAAAARDRWDVRRGERAEAAHGPQPNPLDADVPDQSARSNYMKQVSEAH